MTYRKSKARVQFDNEILFLQKTINSSFTNKCKCQSTRNLALCSAIFICMAKMESYIEDVLSGWIYLINTSKPKTDRLPKSLRAYFLGDHSTLEAYRAFILSKSEQAFIEKLSATIGKKHYLLAFDTEECPELEPKRLRDKKYPSPQNLKSLFNRLGIPKIFQALNKTAKTDLEADLTSFNDIRTEIAHQGIPPGLSVGDVKFKLDRMLLFVRHLDRILFFHISKHTGAETWPS